MQASRTLRTLALVTALSLWALVVTSGVFVMLGYASTPGANANAPTRWPDSSRLARSPNAFTLIMFAHPHCPCTSASVEQLLRVLAKARARVDCHVVFSIPASAPQGWEESSLLRKVESVTRFTAHRDHLAEETVRFDVATSGHVLLFAPGGNLVFSGGITSSRGHEGDNIGASTLIELLNGMTPSHVRAPVFGCPLLDVHEVCSPATCPEEVLP